MSEFIAMGGYGGFVWSAYGFTALVLISLIVRALRADRAAKRALEAAERDGAPLARSPRRPVLRDAEASSERSPERSPERSNGAEGGRADASS